MAPSEARFWLFAMTGFTTARARSRYADSQQLSDDAVADISRMVEEELQSIDFVHPVDFQIFAERLARAPRRAALMIALGTLFEPLPLLHFALSLVDAHQDPDGRTALLSGFASHVAPYLGEPSLAQVGSFVEAWLDERLDAHVRRGGRFHDFPALAYVAPALRRSALAARVVTAMIACEWQGHWTVGLHDAVLAQPTLADVLATAKRAKLVVTGPRRLRE